MSKNKNKKKDDTKKNVDLLNSISGRNKDYDDADGFQQLAPTDEGAAKLDQIRIRRSKKSGSTGAAKPKPVEPRPYEKYNPNAAVRMFEKAASNIKDDKFGKAYDTRDPDVIDELVDAFLHMDQDLPNAESVNSAIMKLLRVGKSFYEYDPKQREFVSNATYDAVLAKYRGMGFEEPVGYVPDNGKKTKIKYPRLHNNMDKCYVIRSNDPVPAGVKESDKIEDFLRRTYKTLGITSEVPIELELSPKIDGVSVNGTIVGDMLTAPQTRGDEDESVRITGMDGLDVGEDVTEHTFGLQYEVFVTDEDRIKASQYLNLATPYVSNRHAAAGLVNRLSSKEDDELLQFLSLYPIETEGLDGTYTERMDFIQNFAVYTDDDMIERKIIKGNMKELLKAIEKAFDSYRDEREDLPYSIDGMVITVTDDDYQKTLGRNGRTNLYQIALKFDPETAEAEVAGIHLDSGKKGFRTIQVDLKHPVFLDGVRYDHVPVLSAGLYDDLGLRVGSKVQVHRVGDVIPSITVIKRGDGANLKLPKKCPRCGGDLEIKNKKLFCGDPTCPGNLAGRILGFIEGIGMEGYSDAFADMLVERFSFTEGNETDIVLHSLKDLFEIDKKALKDVGMTDKIMLAFPDELRKAVAAAPDYMILGSVGIPDVGPARAKLLLRRYNEYEGPYKGWEGLRLNLTKYPDISFIEAFGQGIGKKVAAYMRKNGDNIRYDLAAITEYMENFTERFDNMLRLGHTGTSPSARVRKICAAQKFEIVDGKSFDMLLTSSLDSNSDKMEKARKKNLPILTEEMFLKQYDPDYYEEFEEGEEGEEPDTDSEDDNEEEGSEETEPKVKKGKASKRRRKESR